MRTGPRVGPKPVCRQRSDHVGGGNIGLACPLGLDLQKHRRIMPASLRHRMHWHSPIQKDRFMAGRRSWKRRSRPSFIALSWKTVVMWAGLMPEEQRELLPKGQGPRG